MRLVKNSIILLLILCAHCAYAWNLVGHAVIAQIAYDNLTPKTKTQVDYLVQVFHKTYPTIDSFQTMSGWADKIRGDNMVAFSHWHFVNIPFSTDGTKLPPYPKYNSAWAITQFQYALTNAKQPFNRAMALAFLSHFVGDAHQPLHCSTRVSKQYPNGDKGGNLYPIKISFAKNLHQFWDEGAGLFLIHNNKSQKIIDLAKKIEQQYPKTNVKKSLQYNSPYQWTHYSFDIAKHFVYTTPKNAKPNTAYIKQSQQIVKKQIALAGYRLANILNQALA